MEFKVGYTRDFLDREGVLQFCSIGKEILDREKISSRFLSCHKSPVTADLLEDLDAVISLTPRFNSESFHEIDRLLAIVRFGVGYDMVDIQACTDANVVVCITRGAVNHSVAEAVMTWMLQLGHRSAAKDRLVREGRWNERDQYMGGELRGKTLGIIGFGGIGTKIAKLARAFDMRRILVFDPYLKDQQAYECEVDKTELEVLLKEADYVSVNCPLTDETRNLVTERELGWMKPSAYLINTARGGIVDEGALYDVLKAKKIAGAAVDVFEKEPVDASLPLMQLDNVVLAPHCIAWTDDLFSEIGEKASQCILDIVQGKVPAGVVNPEVLNRSQFKYKLSRFHNSFIP